MWLKWLKKTYVSFTSFFQGRSGETVSIIQVCTQRLVTCLVEPCNCYSFNIYCSLSLKVFRCNLRRIKRNSKPPSSADEAARAKAKRAIFLSLIFIILFTYLLLCFFWGGGGGGGPKFSSVFVKDCSKCSKLRLRKGRGHKTETAHFCVTPNLQSHLQRHAAGGC